MHQAAIQSILCKALAMQLSAGGRKLMQIITVSSSGQKVYAIIVARPIKRSIC